MLSSNVLDVAIGIAFVFLLMATICSAVREGIESFLKTRASFLEFAIREILHDRSGHGLTKSLYDHPLISSLYRGDYQPRTSVVPTLRGRGLPSYIPARSFATVLIDLAARGPATDRASGDPDLVRLSFESLRASVQNLQNPPVQRALLVALDDAQGNLELARKNIEAWYDGAMDRVSGWYKRATQLIIFAVALAIAGVMNVNTITIARELYRSQPLRQAVVASAEHTTSELSYAQAQEKLAGLELPIGWSIEAAAWEENPALTVLNAVCGLLATAFAATLGAPFWFDILNKVMVIRGTVKPHEKSPEEASKDRQRSPPVVEREQVANQNDGARDSAVVLVATVPAHEDDDCGGPIDEPTLDEDLPPARGGVH